MFLIGIARRPSIRFGLLLAQSSQPYAASFAFGTAITRTDNCRNASLLSNEADASADTLPPRQHAARDQPIELSFDAERNAAAPQQQHAQLHVDRERLLGQVRRR